MEPQQVIWVGIDPSRLVEGFDNQGFFGAASFLEFNINPEEIDSKDSVPLVNTKSNSINHPTVNGHGLDTTLTGDIKNIKSEQNIKFESQDFNPAAIREALNQSRAKKFGIPSMCPECGLTMRTITQLEEHVKTVHKTALRFPCDHCDKKLSRKRLQEHKQVVLGMELKYSCKICEQMFTRKRALETHIRNMHPDQITMPYQCNICLKVLRSSETLKNHERQNHREAVAQCKNCSKKFSTEKNYEFHMLQAFCDPAKRKRQCDQCGMRFQQKRELDRHTDARHSDRENLCKTEGCQKVVTSSRELKYHMMEHHNETNSETARNGQFKCTFEKCEKKYLRKGHLDRHMMTHTNERPYQCDNCGMAFHQKGSLKEHVRLHTGEKPYKCQMCPNAFAQGSTFKAHLKTHNDAKTVPDNTEVKTFKSKHANFRDYYLRETKPGDQYLIGQGAAPHLKHPYDDKSASDVAKT